jgi:hypothetical protein
MGFYNERGYNLSIVSLKSFCYVRQRQIAKTFLDNYIIISPLQQPTPTGRDGCSTFLAEEFSYYAAVVFASVVAT